MPPSLNNQNHHQELGSSSCGVALIRSNRASHELVEEGLERLAGFNYRAGVNEVTGESDGAGLRCFGLNPVFFNKQFSLELKRGEFAVGNYFISDDQSDSMGSRDTSTTRAFVENKLKKEGLRVVGWRRVEVNLATLSEAALRKKPAMWQAIIVPTDTTKEIKSEAFEKTILTAALALAYEAQIQNIPLDIVSQSSASVVYKGMVLPAKMRACFLDLQDPDFTADIIEVHGRYATNTRPEWRNAQPCRFVWSHNGEFTSEEVPITAGCAELRARNFHGVYPDRRLSDSMRFDADLVNTLLMYNIPLEEVFVRLMSPTSSSETTPEIRAMLNYFKLTRTPYNGPAFGVASFNGYSFAKSDDFGLRPSRCAMIQHKDTGEIRFHAASDDYIVNNDQWVVIQKSHLEPGGMIMITPELKILRTREILEHIAARYNRDNPQHDYFQQKYQQTVFSLPDTTAATPASNPGLNRRLIAVGWDYEGQDAILHMANNASEKTGAMGDDTNPLRTTMPSHVAYFFSQLFAQVTAPALDSINERKRFTLHVTLGPRVPGPNAGKVADTKQIALRSPILGVNELQKIAAQPHVASWLFDTTFPIPERVSDDAELLPAAISTVLRQVEARIEASPEGGILILSDRRIAHDRAAIPDLIIVAAVQEYLKEKNKTLSFSIVAFPTRAFSSER